MKTRTAAPTVLAAFPREETEMRLEIRKYEGYASLAVVTYAFGPDGVRTEEVIDIRSMEARALAHAIRRAIGDDPADN